MSYSDYKCFVYTCEINKRCRGSVYDLLRIVFIYYVLTTWLYTGIVLKKEIVKSCPASSNKNSQAKIAPHIFRLVGLITADASFLNTVCSEKEVVTIFLSQPFFHGLLLEYSKFFLVTHGISF